MDIFLEDRIVVDSDAVIRCVSISGYDYVELQYAKVDIVHHQDYHSKRNSSPKSTMVICQSCCLFILEPLEQRYISLNCVSLITAIWVCPKTKCLCDMQKRVEYHIATHRINCFYKLVRMIWQGDICINSDNTHLIGAVEQPSNIDFEFVLECRDEFVWPMLASIAFDNRACNHSYDLSACVVELSRSSVRLTLWLKDFRTWKDSNGSLLVCHIV